MTLDLSTFSDEQLRVFLRRTRTRPLIAFLAGLPDADRERLLALLSPTSQSLLRARLSGPVAGSSDYALRILEDIAHPPPCIFCQIVAGGAAGSFVYRDDHISAFMDLYPVTRGHLLIVPNAHAEQIHAVPPDVAGHMLHVAQRIAAGLPATTLGCDGYNLFVANGGASGQDIFHVHLHVIPRYHGDGFGFNFPDGYPQQAARAVLDHLAGQIAACVAL